jgi:hypothetical protein
MEKLWMGASEIVETETRRIWLENILPEWLGYPAVVTSPRRLPVEESNGDAHSCDCKDYLPENS